MATTIRDYPKLAADICDAVGKDNIISAAHCATRLRLVLKETPSAEVTQRISEMPAVIKVMESGGQYQVVIGTCTLLNRMTFLSSVELPTTAPSPTIAFPRMNAHWRTSAFFPMIAGPWM